MRNRHRGKRESSGFASRRMMGQCCQSGLLIGMGWLLVVSGSAAQADPQSPQPAEGFPFQERSELDPFAVQLLGASEAQVAVFERARELKLMEVAPVNLPVDPPGDCNHYGWPIATKTGSTLVVMHRRIPGHNPRGAGGPHELMSYGMVLRSEDNGRTWSEPYDLRECMAPEDRQRDGRVPLSHRFKFEKENLSPLGYKIHLHSIGTTNDGGVIAINNHGVFRSDDEGRSWRHFSEAFRDNTFPHQIVNMGPRVIDHPDLGLTAFGNWFGTVEGPKFTHSLVILTSRDDGGTWGVEEHDVGFPQYEPAALWHGDRFLMITRDQEDGGRHRQISWRPGESPVIKSTNLRDPRYVDTVDFTLNPVTGRFEVLRSERYRMELALWSMDPSDWPAGEWRRECRLLKQKGRFYREADGFHPAAAVIDERLGVQHIFIYSGHPNGPAGVFRITRTLDTDRLAEFLNTAAEETVDLQPGVRPKNDVHLYLLIGQSNMAGRAEVEEIDRVRHPRVFSLNQDRMWVPAVDPLHSDRANAGVGLGSTFGRIMAEANPEITVGLIPSAVGGTRLERWEKGGDLWQQAIERTREAQRAGQLRGVLWHQGEADGLERETAETYAKRLAQVVNDLRQELGDPQLPFVAGKLGEFLPENRKDGLPAYWPLVNEQIATLALLVKNAAVIESSGLSHLGDSVHFDATSLRIFGKRYAAAMRQLQLHK